MEAQIIHTDGGDTGYWIAHVPTVFACSKRTPLNVLIWVDFRAIWATRLGV